jgi:hypothetical protein
MLRTDSFSVSYSHSLEQRSASAGEHEVVAGVSLEMNYMRPHSSTPMRLKKSVLL